MKELFSSFTVAGLAGHYAEGVYFPISFIVAKIAHSSHVSQVLYTFVQLSRSKSLIEQSLVLQECNGHCIFLSAKIILNCILVVLFLWCLYNAPQATV